MDRGKKGIESTWLRVPSRTLFKMCRTSPNNRIPTAWIWKVVAYPKVWLLLWKVVWDRLPMHALLRDTGMRISMSCPVCGLVDESPEHTILHCPRARLVWRMIASQSWVASTSP